MAPACIYTQARVRSGLLTMILSEHYYHYVDLYISCETIEKELNPHMIKQRLPNHFEISECFAFRNMFCVFFRMQIWAAGYKQFLWNLPASP